MIAKICSSAQPSPSLHPPLTTVIPNLAQALRLALAAHMSIEYIIFGLAVIEIRIKTYSHHGDDLINFSFKNFLALPRAML